jgi:hypothetical protein
MLTQSGNGVSGKYITKEKTTESEDCGRSMLNY